MLLVPVPAVDTGAAAPSKRVPVCAPDAMVYVPTLVVPALKFNAKAPVAEIEPLW
jgi:hypothetical protein